MPTFKEGERVSILSRPQTGEDRLSNDYFEHMGGLTGVVQNVYGPDEIAVKVDIDGLSKITKDVHKEAVRRMREKFLNNISEEQKKHLTAAEMNFDAHFMLLVRGSDLQKAT